MADKVWQFNVYLNGTEREATAFQDFLFEKTQNLCMKASSEEGKTATVVEVVGFNEFIDEEIDPSVEALLKVENSNIFHQLEDALAELDDIVFRLRLQRSLREGKGQVGEIEGGNDG